MNYRLDQDRFYHLLDDIIAQGGRHEHGPCKPTKVKYDPPVDPGMTHGCRKEFRVALPYQGEDGMLSDVVACAEGDAVELWPRFNGGSI